MSAFASVLVGARSAWGGTSRRRVVSIGVVSIAIAVLVGLLERRAGPVGASDRALTACFRLLIPIMVAAMSTAIVGLRNLREAAWPVARFGRPRGAVALGFFALTALLSAGIATLCAVTAVLASRAGVAPVPGSSGAMSLVADVFTSAWIAGLIGIAYAAWFTFGATFGKIGNGRGVVLIADFIVGDVGFFGVVLPRGAAYALIGLSSPMDLPQRASSAAIVGVIVVLVGGIALRCRDR